LTLSLGNSLTGLNTVHALPQSPAVSHAPFLLRSGNTTAKGSSGVAFNSTTLFDWITLTGAVFPPHAESPLVIDHKGEDAPDQSEQSKSFELVSPPSIGAVNGSGGN